MNYGEIVSVVVGRVWANLLLKRFEKLFGGWWMHFMGLLSLSVRKMTVIDGRCHCWSNGGGQESLEMVIA